ncbi:Methyltransferase domain protein [Rickettsiales bacterium Ac37b]|nr:Methyltransferase domain protein [Rickettsiales bacterium Ac37b]
MNRTDNYLFKDYNFFISKNDLSLQYDTYYEGGNSSLYNKRFGHNKTIYKEKELITNSFKRIYNRKKQKAQNNKIKILDFGCGDGRLFEILEDLALSYTNKEYTVELINYDISYQAIKLFEDKLLNNDFSSCNEATISKQDIITKTFTKQNLLVKLIHTDSSCDKAILQELLGKDFDIILCIFGVLAHIPGKQNRSDTLKLFKSISNENAELIFTMPTIKSFWREYLTYTKLRKQLECGRFLENQQSYKSQVLALRLAQEKGDIYYCTGSKTQIINNFLHIYSINELVEELKEVDLQILKTPKLLSIKHPFEISSSPSKSFIDALLSEIFSLFCIPNSVKIFFGKHFSVVAINKN